MIPTVAPLYEGTFSVGLDRKFIRIGRDDPPREKSLKLSINPFLIKTGERNILFDAGLGEFGEDTSTATILENLGGHGLAGYDITDIFLSHLHYDHTGGLAGRENGYWELTFPDARLWVSRREWTRLISSDGGTDDDTKLEFLHFLDAKADLNFLDEEDQPCNDIRVSEIGGHTEHSQVLFYEKDAHRYMMAGDVIGVQSEINRRFAAKYDAFPKKSMAVREDLKKQAFEEGYIIMAYHETDSPLFRLTEFEEEKNRYKIKPVHIPESG